MLVSVSGSQALALEWENGVPGTYYLAQSPALDPVDGVERKDVTCAFPAEANQGTIDASFMSQLPSQTTLSTYLVRIEDQILADKRVRVRTVIDVVDETDSFPLKFMIE